MRRLARVLAPVVLWPVLAGAQAVPEGWTSRTTELPRCDGLPMFEMVQETADTARRVRQLHLWTWSAMDAYSHLHLTYDTFRRLRRVEWAFEADWDYGTLVWTLDGLGRVQRVTSAGQRDGIPYDLTLPNTTPVPAAFRFQPSPAAYATVACMDVPWPTP